jgi:syndecan 1
MTTDGGDRALGAPRFDVVLRGYDRRQVDEYVARLHRVNSRLRADLEMARSVPPPPPARDLAPPPGYPSAPPAARPRPSPRPRSGPQQPERDVVDGFTDRMQSILSAAEEEAAEIRRQALASRPGEDLRAQVADLAGQRDAVLSELAKMRGLLETIMASGWGAVEATGPAPAVVPASVAPTSPAPADDAAQPLPGTSGPTSTEEEPSTPPSSGAQAAAEPTADEVPESKGAHRLPTGEYRSVADRFGSMRPRSEPDPEPSELFRPRSDGGAAASTSSEAADRPRDAGSGAEATVKVGAVRPAEATSPPEAAEEPPKELPQRTANGTGSRTSASRSR